MKSELSSCFNLELLVQLKYISTHDKIVQICWLIVPMGSLKFINSLQSLFFGGGSLQTQGAGCKTVWEQKGSPAFASALPVSTC